MGGELRKGETDLLVEGLSDDVAFVWVLIDLGLRGNPPTDPGSPSLSEVDAALDALARLSVAGLIRVGHMEYVDGGPPGRVAPVKHVEEPIEVVKARVLDACRGKSDWEFSCWVVNTPEGDKLAREAI